MQTFESIVYQVIKEICGLKQKSSKKFEKNLKIPKLLQKLVNLKRSARRVFRKLKKAKNPDVPRLKSAYKNLMMAVKAHRDYSRLLMKENDSVNSFFEKFFRDPHKFSSNLFSALTIVSQILQKS